MMEKPPTAKRPQQPPNPGRQFNMPVVIMLILAGLALVTMLAREQASSGAVLSYDQFVREVKGDNVSAVTITGNTLRGEFKTPPGGDAAAPKTFSL